MPVLSWDAFNALFDTADRSLSRLESRRHTDIVDERDEFQAFLAGERPEVRVWEESWWTRMVADHAAAGRPFRRVRVVDDPLTDYNRYMIWGGARNAAVGEDLRYLARADADALELPDHDFWIFDEERLAELRFTDGGRFIGQDLITDPDIVARHVDWVDRAHRSATPSGDYVAADPTRAWPPSRLGAAKGA